MPSDLLTLALMPRPVDACDSERWDESSLRHRLVTGRWQGDALDREADFFAAEVREHLPAPEISHNPVLSGIQQCNVLYEEDPTVTVRGVPAGVDLTPLIPDELWPLCQERVKFVEAMGEAFFRLDWREEAGITIRLVTSDCIARVRTASGRPYQPIALEELVERTRKSDGKAEWTWEVWDVSDPKAPLMRVEAVRATDGQEVRVDVTEEYTGSTEYPWRDRNKAPIMPYIAYHRRVTGNFWNPFDGMEIVRGTMTVAALWTMWVGGFRDGSFPTRYLIDGAPQSNKLTPVGKIGVDIVQASPGVVVNIASKGDGRSASAGQWNPVMDPESAGKAVESFEAGLAMYLGISPADITRGSQGASGYSLVVSRDGLRRAQRRMRTPARMSDRLYFATAARMLNANAGFDLPEDPKAYELEYRGLPRTWEEVKADLEEVTMLTAAGLMHPAAAYQRMHPGLSRDEALAELADIAAYRAAMAALTAPAGPVIAGPVAPVDPDNPVTGESL